MPFLSTHAPVDLQDSLVDGALLRRKGAADGPAARNVTAVACTSQSTNRKKDVGAQQIERPQADQHVLSTLSAVVNNMSGTLAALAGAADAVFGTGLAPYHDFRSRRLT